MIKTEEQRRWWFATHPEYSGSHRGIKARSKDRGDDDKASPEEVDKYVDEALPHARGPFADFLKSLKRNFGTQGQLSGTGGLANGAPSASELERWARVTKRR